MCNHLVRIPLFARIQVEKMVSFLAYFCPNISTIWEKWVGNGVGIMCFLPVNGFALKWIGQGILGFVTSASLLVILDTWIFEGGQTKIPSSWSQYYQPLIYI